MQCSKLKEYGTDTCLFLKCVGGICETTQCGIPEDCNLDTHCHENLNCYTQMSLLH